jgi:hypothetical protein
VKLKCVVMLGDFFLKTNEISLERIGGQTLPFHDSVEYNLIGISDDIEARENRENKEEVWFIKSKSVKMSFHVLPFILFYLL